MSKFVAAAALALGLAASQASAVTVVGATSVHIENAIPNWLQVAEVQAVTFASVNVAAAANGGTASGSPEYQNNGFATPDKAIDGNTGGNYYTDTIYHSGTPNAGQFLDVFFAAPATLASLSLYGRTDGAGDRDLYNVTIYRNTTVLYSGQIDSRNMVGTVTFDAPSAVPEAATWTMLIAGFGMVGLGMRSRKSTVAA